MSKIDDEIREAMIHGRTGKTTDAAITENLVSIVAPAYCARSWVVTLAPWSPVNGQIVGIADVPRQVTVEWGAGNTSNSRAQVDWPRTGCAFQIGSASAINVTYNAPAGLPAGVLNLTGGAAPGQVAGPGPTFTSPKQATGPIVPFNTPVFFTRPNHSIAYRIASDLDLATTDGGALEVWQDANGAAKDYIDLGPNGNAWWGSQGGAPPGTGLRGEWVPLQPMTFRVAIDGTNLGGDPHAFAVTWRLQL